MRVIKFLRSTSWRSRRLSNRSSLNRVKSQCSAWHHIWVPALNLYLWVFFIASVPVGKPYIFRVELISIPLVSANAKAADSTKGRLLRSENFQEPTGHHLKILLKGLRIVFKKYNMPYYCASFKMIQDFRLPSSDRGITMAIISLNQIHLCLKILFPTSILAGASCHCRYWYGLVCLSYRLTFATLF